MALTIQSVTLACWRDLLAAGVVTLEGLMLMRRRLRFGGEFTGPDAAGMLAEVEVTIADLLGVNLADIPGQLPRCPDTIEGWDA